MVRRINPDHSRMMHEHVAQLEQQFFVPSPEGSEAIAPTDPTQMLGQLPDDEARIWALTRLANRGAVDMDNITAPDISDQFDTIYDSTVATEVARYMHAPKLDRFVMRVLFRPVRRAIKHGLITK